MSHLKRISMAKRWPLPRKGTKYVLKSYPGKSFEISMPLGIALRDILKVTSTRKETKALLHNKDVKINGKINEEEKFPLSIFDVLSIPKLNKNFIFLLNESGKIIFEEINEKDAQTKVCKVINQKILGKGIKQINCMDGWNFICKDKISVNDSLLIDLKENKILKILPLKVGSEVFIMGGAHAGEKGKIAEKDKKIIVNIKNKNFEIQAKNIVVIR